MSQTRTIPLGEQPKASVFLHLEVLRNQLFNYKMAFKTVVEEARKLDLAIGKHLAQEAENISGDDLYKTNAATVKGSFGGHLLRGFA